MVKFELFCTERKTIEQRHTEDNSRFSESAIPSTPKNLFPWWKTNPE